MATMICAGSGMSPMNMPAKPEASEFCRLCLSTERELSSVEGVLWAFRVVTDIAKPLCSSDYKGRVCWECRAILKRLQRLKDRAKRAQDVLNNLHELANSHGCLSQLAVVSKTSFDAEFYSDLESDVILNTFDGQLETKLFDPKIEIDIRDEEITLLDVWADPVNFDTAKTEEEAENTTVVFDRLKEDIDDLGTAGEVHASIAKYRRNSSNNRNKLKASKSYRKTFREPPSERKDGHRKFWNPKRPKKGKTVGTAESCENCGGIRRRSRIDNGHDKQSQNADAPYKCVGCDISFKFEKSLFRHNKRKHSGLSTQCSNANVYTEMTVDLTTEAPIEDIYQPKSLLDWTSPEKTLKVSSERISAPVVACSCDDNRPPLRREDKSSSKVKLPVRNIETGTFDCDVCGAKLKSDEYFRLHYEAHVSDKSYECETCGNIYKTRAQMFKHLIVHKPHRYLCHICGKSKLSMGSLNIHFLSHSSLEARPHKCTICSRTFITRDKLKIHSRFHDGVKPFKCSLCSSAFYVNFELTKHMKTNHSVENDKDKVKKGKVKRTVSLCRNARMRQGEKAEGLQSEDEKKKPSNKNDLTCDICGKTFAQKVCLDAHVVVHTGDRPFKCEECGQTFKFQSNVLTHAKSVHMADKVHQCTICGARFKLKGNLTAHFKIHSGEKPFSCDVCDQKFIRSRNLRNHYKVHAK